MALDWLSLRTDKEKYPDDATIEWNGEKLSVGELRKQLGPVSDFTKQTQKLSQERDQATQAYQQAQAQFANAQAQLQQLQAQRQALTSDDPLNPYRQDPAFSPLVSYFDKQISEMKTVMQQQAQHVQQATVAVNAWRYGTEIDKLKSQDADLDPQKLAQFTTELYTKGPDVSAAYKLMTYDDRLKKAEQEAERRGYEKAKAEPPAPPVPGGRRGTRPAGSPELPKDLNARATLALQDTELMSQVQQGLQELSGG